MKKSVQYSLEVMERAVRWVFEARVRYESPWAAIVSIAAKIVYRRDTPSVGSPARVVPVSVRVAYR